MVTVWTVFNGHKYDETAVYRMREAVRCHLWEPHRFRCLADRQIPGVDCLVPDEDWPGWWAKLLLFRYATGHNLYTDLDNLIVGSLDGALSTRLSMPANWAQSGHGGCQSSVMAWGQDYGHIADRFDPALLGEPGGGHCGRYGPARLWGDQEFITNLLGDPGGEVIPMTGVFSYKYHCRDGLPANARVVCFHGQPKPEQVSDPWVQAALSSTATGD